LVERPPARLSVILARDRPIAAVFRRGPSRWTRLLEWRTDTDELVEGDWFRGRVYSRRSDLSPNGKYLVCFAASFGAGVPGLNLGYSWTEVSVLPSLQPVASWTKDHCWFGGGLFTDDERLWVNELPPGRSTDHELGFTLSFNADARGEDEPVYSRRLTRDGWHVVQERNAEFDGHRFVTHAAELRHKNDGDGGHLEVARSIEGFSDVDLFAYVTADGRRFDLEVEWADFDQSGRLVAAKHGTLLELHRGGDGISVRPIADLNGMQPPASTPVR